MGRRHDRQPPLHLYARECPLDLPLAATTRRRERDHLVRSRLREAEQGATNVVAHARTRVRERSDVDDDPHAPRLLRGHVIEVGDVHAEQPRIGSGPS